MSNPPWNRPAECSRWSIVSERDGVTLFRRREKWKATAYGYLAGEGEPHVHYRGVLSDCGRGYTREEAENSMRALICADIKAYQEYSDARKQKVSQFSAKDVCPC